MCLWLVCAHFLSPVSELPDPISVCPCETKIWSREWILSSFNKRDLYFVTHYMCSTTCNAMRHLSINQTFISFLWVWNVTSDIEGIMCFEELWEKSHQEYFWLIEGVNNRKILKVIWWGWLLELFIMLTVILLTQHIVSELHLTKATRNLNVPYTHAEA